MDRFKVPDFSVKVTDAQFGAKGDAFTDDTKAIQAAIDYVAAQGGGVVILPGDTEHWYGRRYIATNINLKSNIELRVEKGAMIWQSQRVEEYDYSSNSFLDAPVFGHDNDREGVVWAHSINDNLPLVYVGGGYDEVTGKWGEAIRNVRITGGGIIRMMDTGGSSPILIITAGIPTFWWAATAVCTLLQWFFGMRRAVIWSICEFNVRTVGM